MSKENPAGDVNGVRSWILVGVGFRRCAAGLISIWSAAVFTALAVSLSGRGRKIPKRRRPPHSKLKTPRRHCGERRGRKKAGPTPRHDSRTPSTPAARPPRPPEQTDDPLDLA